MGSPWTASYAAFLRAVQFLCLNMCVYGGRMVPQGGRHLATFPQGVAGDRPAWGGAGQGGEGTNSQTGIQAHLHQTCHWCPAGEPSSVRNQPCTMCHSVISAPVAPGAQ